MILNDDLRLTHFLLKFSQIGAQILMKFGSYIHLSNVSQDCSNQDCMTYFHRSMLMSFWVVTLHIFTMYYYMSVCNIPFVTSSLKTHRFASNFVWMFLGWTPTRLDKIRVLPLFRMKLLLILCIFVC